LPTSSSQKHGQVRAAACTVLAMLGITNEEVVNTLRDRLTADADIRVKRASTDALLALGMKPEKDASLIVAIKEAVKKLGTKDAILASIIKSDNNSCSELGSASSDRIDVKQAASIMEVIAMSKAKSRGQSREKNTSENKQNWPEPKQVIEVDEKMKKAEKIQESSSLTGSTTRASLCTSPTRQESVHSPREKVSFSEFTVDNHGTVSPTFH